ncbi:MAG: lamin tail domain-containing protein [Microcystaceae cyanobacterium]
MKKLILIGLLLLLWLGTPIDPATADGTPGEFDYYVLSLSWSPEYCDTAPSSDPQCKARKYGFVAHGLWPQYEKGYPSYCSASSKVPDEIMEQMLPIMPSKRLIQHEWDKHGTCSGLNKQGYFDLTQKLYQQLTIPKIYRDLDKYMTTSVEELEDNLIEDNGLLTGERMGVICKKRYLKELRICYTKDLNPRPCSSDVRDKCGSKVVLRPIRTKPLITSNDSVVITSAMVNPFNPEQGKEWVILSNTSDKPVDLSGWKIQDGKGRVERIKGDIRPNEEIKIVFSGHSVKLTNSGGTITLINGRGQKISEVSYSSTVNGKSITF